MSIPSVASLRKLLPNKPSIDCTLPVESTARDYLVEFILSSMKDSIAEAMEFDHLDPNDQYLGIDIFNYTLAAGFDGQIDHYENDELHYIVIDHDGKCERVQHACDRDEPHDRDPDECQKVWYTRAKPSYDGNPHSSYIAVYDILRWTSTIEKLRAELMPLGYRVHIITSEIGYNGTYIRVVVVFENPCVSRIKAAK